MHPFIQKYYFISINIHTLAIYLHKDTILYHMQQISQREVFSQELQRLKTDVTPQDRKDALTVTGVTNICTISSYLNGDVRNNDVAAKLIKFLRERINERAKVLEENS